jgi:hypothetical protein
LEDGGGDRIVSTDVHMNIAGPGGTGQQQEPTELFHAPSFGTRGASLDGAAAK